MELPAFFQLAFLISGGVSLFPYVLAIPMLNPVSQHIVRQSTHSVPDTVIGPANAMLNRREPQSSRSSHSSFPNIIPLAYLEQQLYIHAYKFII